jgi:hypothetical protein
VTALVTLHAQIRALLVGLPAVASIVGAEPAARIRCDYFQAGDGGPSTPAILVEIDSQAEANDLAGVSGGVIGQFTLTCRAATLEAAAELAEAIRTNGTDPGTGLAGYSSASLDLVLESSVDTWTAKEDASEDGWFDTVMSWVNISAETI